MQTTGLARAPQMHYMKRDQNHRRPTVTPRQPLPPREIFTGQTDLLAKYDRMAALNDAMAEHQTAEMRLQAEATAAEQDYHRNVREAMATGQDPAKVTNKADNLRAQAKGHVDFGTQAKTAATALGFELGELIAAAAPALFEQSETTMTKAATDVIKAVAHLRATWSTWGLAWNVRCILGSAHYAGGQIGGYRPHQPLPPEVDAALKVIEDHLQSLDRLKSDEANVTEFRAANVPTPNANEPVGPKRIR